MVFPKCIRGGPQSLDRQAAELRWNLLFIGCCLIDQYTSSLSSKKPAVDAVDSVGERLASGGRRWVTVTAEVILQLGETYFVIDRC